jgi:lysophospholipase L1-like esterase
MIPPKNILHSQSISGKKLLLFRVLALLGVLLSVELFGQFITYAKTGIWLWKIPMTPHELLFQRHPWLLASGKPNGMFRKGQTIMVRHNSRGYRGPDFTKPRPLHEIRLICYGGSTTYGSYLSDPWTWPVLLQKSLGNQYEVLNAGVPGYTTVEHVIQAAVQQFDRRPDYALYYVGYNDLINNNIENVAEDSSDVHAPLLEQALRLNSLRYGDRSYILTTLWHGLYAFATKQYSRPVRGEVSEKIDPRALALFKDRIESLILLCRHHGIQPIFIPQIINPSLKSNTSKAIWAVYVPLSALPRLMDRYNQEVEQICRREHVPFINKMNSAPWEKSDFFDECHFTASGSVKFSHILQEELPHMTAPSRTS